LHEGWRQRLGDLVVRRPRQRAVQSVHLKPHRERRFFLSPATSALLSLTGGFALLIAVGTVMLEAPFASVDEGSTSFLTALFTATSAACVTGLVVVDTATYWTGFGQFVIAMLMFMGGLGIMTAGALLLLALGRRLTLTNRLVLREPMGAATLGGVSRLGTQVLLFVVGVQAVGFIVLFLKFLGNFSVGEAAWQALFHAISSFNNGGFVILPNSQSLSAYQDDHLLLAVMGVLIVLGAISFSVVADLAAGRRFNRLSLDTRLVVMGTVFLWLLGGLAMLLFELDNPETLGGLSVADQVGNVLFQTVTSRTAGFSTLDFGATRSATDAVYMVLMFIGGAAASTAGGIKVNTAMVLLIAAWASVQGRSRAEVFKREVPYAQVARAMALVVLSLVMLFSIVLALAWAEDARLRTGEFEFMDLMFEAFSAIGTTGLSRGISPDLSELGKYIVTLAMYLGRLGPLSIALGLALRERRAIYRYAEEKVRIG